MKGTELIAIRNQLIRAAAVGAIGVTAVAGFVAPASAATAGVHVSTAGVHVAVRGPNTNIQGSPAKWSPTKLTGPPVSGTCSKTNYTFSITNKTKTTKTILYKTGTTKKKLGTVAAGVKKGVCGSGPKGAKAKFYIKGSTSVLTVTLS